MVEVKRIKNLKIAIIFVLEYMKKTFKMKLQINLAIK